MNVYIVCTDKSILKTFKKVMWRLGLWPSDVEARSVWHSDVEARSVWPSDVEARSVWPSDVEARSVD